MSDGLSFGWIAQPALFETPAGVAPHDVRLARELTAADDQHVAMAHLELSLRGDPLERLSFRFGRWDANGSGVLLWLIGHGSVVESVCRTRWGVKRGSSVRQHGLER